MNKLGSYKTHRYNMFISILLLTLYLVATLPTNAQTILLENVSIIDGKSDFVRHRQFILIENDVISKIGPHPYSSDIENITRLNYSGYYVLPGLIDAHVHLATDPSDTDRIELSEQRLSIMLRNGITGVRDMAGDVRQLAYLARQAGLDEIISPDIYYSALMAGPIFFDDPRTKAASKGYESGTAAWMLGVSPDDNLDLLVAAAKGSGASGIKLYADMSGELVKRIIKSANQQNMPVWAHASVIPSMPSDAVNAGVGSLSHATLLAWESSEKKPASGKSRNSETLIDVSHPRFKSLLIAMRDKQIFLEPTLLIYNDGTRAQVFENGVKATKAAYEAGVPLIVGTDENIDIENFTHLPLINEMIALVDLVGMAEMDVIKATTINSAVLLGIDHQVGAVENGKKANLLVVKSNPIDDLRNLKSVIAVFKNGKKVE